MDTSAVKGSEPRGRSKVDLSVVIPTYNGERTIADCLNSVQRAVGRRRAEIIVVDSSTDSTPDVVRRRFPELILLRSEKRLSAGEARNRGVALARGSLIFFTDQDCVVPEDWIDRLEKHFRDPKIDGAGGAVGIFNIASASGCALYFLEFLYHFPGSGPPQCDGRFLVGCNAAYRPEVLRVAHFPDQTLGEDVLFWYELRGRQLRTVYDPSIEVLHQNKEGWRTFFAYNHRMGRAAATYHEALGLAWAMPFLRYPSLVFAAPLAILSWIGFGLLRSRPSYLWRFIALLPMCFLGNLSWACGFWRQAHRTIAANRGAKDVACRPPEVETQDDPRTAGIGHRTLAQQRRVPPRRSTL
jgi:GT2 family glycosyltransferase